MPANIPLTDPDRENPNEYTEVEYPMLAQLAGMGWDYLQGNRYLRDAKILGCIAKVASNL